MRLKEIKVKWIWVVWVYFGIENLFNNEATAQTEKTCLGKDEEKFIKAQFIELLNYNMIILEWISEVVIIKTTYYSSFLSCQILPVKEHTPTVKKFRESKNY